MIGVVCGIMLVLVSALAILFFPFSKKGEFLQRYGRLLALIGMVAGILLAVLFAWKGL
ncbi:MAG: hypothetical protein ACOYU3_07150 [Bacillota bacterium]